MLQGCKLLVTIGLIANGLYGQSVSAISPTSDQFPFFDHFFQTLGDSTQASMTLQHRERAAVTMLRLSPSEADMLHALAQQYELVDTKFNEGVQAVTAKKTVLAQTDLAALETLNVQRQQVVAIFATSLLQQLSPASSKEVLNIIAKGRP